MNYRKLRIVSSVVCAVVCVILIDAWVNAGDDRVLINPWEHVIYVAITAALTVIPWLRWRFCLRTLLIATTLVAVVLGLAVYVIRK